jgi:P4 family phage/plasmid primase-like protien
MSEEILTEKVGEVKQALNTLLLPDQVVELRALSVGGTVWTGIYAPDDRPAMAEKAKELSEAPGFKAVYFTLNPLRAETLGSGGRGRGGAAVDEDVESRALLLIDLDPERPKDVSSTDEEKKSAWAIISTVREFLRDRGFPEPVLADSGNGYHLLYRIDLPADDGGLVKRFLKALHARFSTPEVKVDTTVHNPSRICKLYGTWARKGWNPPVERPHRLSKLLEGPAGVLPVPRTLLESVAGDPEPERTETPVATENGLADEQVIERAGNAANSEKFNRLWAGDTTGYSSASEADAALCSILAFWVGPDREGIDRLFRRSKLYREKWEREDYREKTIDLALAGRTEFYRQERDDSPAIKLAKLYLYGPRYRVKADYRHAARVLYIGFALSEEDALPLLLERFPELPAEQARAEVDEAAKKDCIRGKMLILEPEDSPHRLALWFIDEGRWKEGQSIFQRYAGTWWVWDGQKYREVDEDTMRSHVTADVQEQFEKWHRKLVARELGSRRNARAVSLDHFDEVLARGPEALLNDAGILAALAAESPGRYELRRLQMKKAKISVGVVDRAVKAARRPNKLPECQSVTCRRVADVLQALNSLDVCNLFSSMPTMIGDPQTDYVAFSNGILDLDAAVRGEGSLRPHTPKWFSPVCLPYAYDPVARGPRWTAHVDRVMQGDPERVLLLQEWFGYNLTADTSLHKFMMFYGEARTGKSTCCNVLEAALGRDNVSHVRLEEFNKNFGLWNTIGKLANIAAEIGEVDRVEEGVLKQFVTGDPIQIDRKYQQPVTVRPTARLTFATNTLPHFFDRSDGIWTRLLILPFLEVIPPEERVPGMDDPKWWADELPGIFNWALEGLRRLRQQGHFTRSSVCDAEIARHRLDCSTTATFFAEHCKQATDASVDAGHLYQAYVNFCRETGVRSVSKTKFGREVKKHFKVELVRGPEHKGGRPWIYPEVCCSYSSCP